MSDLLNKASLVMVPSGYKEDTVYSVIPTDGSGDLTFTRASDGTRINSQGLVEVVPWNLASYSEDFGNVVWAKTNATITANDTTAPNGTTTADKFAPNGTLSTSYFSISETVVSGATSQAHTAIIYAKAGGLTQMLMYLGSQIGIYFNLSNGQFISYYNGVQTITNYSSEAVGDGWYKYTISISGNSGSTYLEVYGAKSGAFIGNYTTADNCFIWGAQLNIGSTAKPYFPTTDRLNVPRLTYQNGGGGCPSLLLEKQSTNKITYSEQFDNAAWTKANVTITANSVTSPDGTQNADTITDNTTNGAHVVYQISSGSSVGTAWTCYMKKGSLNYGYIGAIQSTNLFTTAIINLNDGSIVELQNGSSTTGTVTTENCGNGWYRVKMQSNVNSAGISVGTSNGSPLSGTYKEAIYTGTGSGTIYIWGAQLEDSSYPTSYIPTTSSSATRVVDACYKTGISSLIGQTEGTMFVDFYYNLANNTPNGSDKGIMTIRPNGGSYSNEIALLYYGDEGGSYGKTIQVTVTVGGVLQCSLKTPQTLTNGYYKVAFAYKQNDFAFYVNGTQIGTDTSGSVPTCDELYLVDPLRINQNTTIKEAILFPTRLTNAELASLTTI